MRETTGCRRTMSFLYSHQDTWIHPAGMLRPDHHMRQCFLCINNILNDLESVTAANKGGRCKNWTNLYAEKSYPCHVSDQQVSTSKHGWEITVLTVKAMVMLYNKTSPAKRYYQNITRNWSNLKKKTLHRLCSIYPFFLKGRRVWLNTVCKIISA